MFVNVTPPSMDTCHCTVLPTPSAAVNVAVAPAHAVWFDGFVVTTGAELTVNVAADVVTEAQEFVKTARNLLLLSVDAVVKLYVAELAPLILVNVMPSGETCHCTVLFPFAAAVKVAVVPLHTV